jgi:hypothetical protein
MLKESQTRKEQGTILTLTAAMLVALVGVMALVIDLGHLYVVKGELQRAADAGAVAGAMKMFNLPPGSQYPVSATPDCSRALAACQAIVAANKADGAALSLSAGDVTFGRWDAATRTFVPTGCAAPQQVTGVKVVVRKDSSANGPVSLSFLGLLPGGWSTASLSAQALGFNGYAGYAPAGSHVMPFLIDAGKAPPGHAGEPVIIHLNPTTGDGGCWHTFDDKSPGASDLRGLIDGTIPSPPLQVGDLVKAKEGVADSVLQTLRQQLDARGGEWTVLCPVIDGSSHSGWVQITGFVAFKLTAVDAQGGDKYLQGYTVPNYVAPGLAPGGANYGLWAGVTKLVQ